MGVRLFIQVNWMPMPENVAPGCPPGLEYLTQVDQLLVHQQIELLECMLKLRFPLL